MELTKLSKDELVSHTDEILTTQQAIIRSLREKQQILLVVISLLLINAVI